MECITSLLKEKKAGSLPVVVSCLDLQTLFICCLHAWNISTWIIKNSLYL